MLKNTPMRNLKINLLLFFKKFWPIIGIILVVSGFYWRVFVFKEVPLPGDFIVGVYHPWLDYKWGTIAGVPVKNPITTDVVSFTYPMQTLAMSLVKRGIWPLWNPYILAGTTLLANFQSAPFSPTSFVYFLFNNVTAWSVQVILQHVFAAIFTYLLLRHWKVSKLGSIFGGIVYAFSGYNLIFSEWNGHTLAAAFIPLALFFTDRFLEKQKYWDGFFLSLTLAFQFFSGYTQTSVYTAIAIGILWFVRIFRDKKWLLKTLLLSFFCAFGIALSAVQILPSVELINNSQRIFEPHPFEWTFLPWKKTITFVAPDYFGNHATGNYWGPQDYTSNTGYVGVTATVLSIFAVLVLIKKREVQFLLIFTIISLVLSFPDPISIFIWDKNILGMQANSAHRATQLFCAGIAFLSAFGFDALMKKRSKLFQLFVSLFPIYLLMATFGLFALVLYKNSIGVKNLIFPGLILLGVTFILFLIWKFKSFRKVGGLVLIILAMAELFRFGWKYTPISPSEFTYPTTPILSFIMNQPKPFRVTGAKVIPSNLRMVYGIESPEGYDTFHPLNMSEFVAAINSGSIDSLPVGRYGIVDNDVSPLLDLINTKYYLALVTDPDIKRFDPKRFVKVFQDKSVIIFESKSSLPRAFMAYDWEVDVPQKYNDLTSLGKIMQKDFPLGKRIILDSSPNLTIDTVSKIKPIQSVKYEIYENQESLINVKTDRDGMLFVSDSYYPGWRAFIDGKETKIYTADFAFRAIEIPKGEHKVKMIYEPKSFSDGIKISVVSLVLLLCLFIPYKLYFKKKFL